MIQLNISPYCEDCQDFEPLATSERAQSLDGKHHTYTNVYCKYAEHCKGMYEQLKGQMQNEH